MKNSLVAIVLALLAVVSARAETIYTPGNGVVAPRVTQKVKPIYPPAAEKAHRQGTVLLDCVVASDGTMSDISVARASDDEFSDAAVAAAWLYRFEPGTKDGHAVAVRIALEIVFTLR
jgi:TonB family protein